MATKNVKRIEQAEKKLAAADEELRRVLLSIFPKGACVAVLLKHGQVVETPGVIVGCCASAPAHMLVRIDTAKEGSKRPIRSVYYKNIFGPYN